MFLFLNKKNILISTIFCFFLLKILSPIKNEKVGPFKGKTSTKKTILVTGGDGYIGSCTAYLLMQNGYDVIIIDKMLHHENQAYPWQIFFKADFADKKILDEIFSNYPIYCVMHFAALAEVATSVQSPKEYYETNVTKTLELLNTMLKYNVKKFIFSSSCSTYGNPVKLPIDENHPTNPISPYGKTKMMIDLALEDYSHAYDLRYVSLRYFNAAGALPESNLGEYHNPETHVIPLLLKAIKNNNSFTIFGSNYDTEDGTCIRDFLHVKDIAQAHIQALKYLEDNQKSIMCNLGTGRGYSVKEIIKTAEHITKKETLTNFASRRAGDPSTMIANPHKALIELGWSPQCSDLSNILKSAWQWELKGNEDAI